MQELAVDPTLTETETDEVRGRLDHNSRIVPRTRQRRSPGYAKSVAKQTHFPIARAFTHRAIAAAEFSIRSSQLSKDRARGITAIPFSTRVGSSRPCPEVLRTSGTDVAELAPNSRANPTAPERSVAALDAQRRQPRASHEGHCLTCVSEIHHIASHRDVKSDRMRDGNLVP
jgi:hypothetical protein